MLRRNKVLLWVVLALSVAGAAFAQDAGVVNTFAGTISNPTQEDTVAFEVDPALVELNGSGAVDYVFIMRATDDSIDPGLISIEVKEGGSVNAGLRKPDTPGSNASIALATLTPGMYEFTLRTEKKTIGTYSLDVLLAGDADGNFIVDAEDVQLISQLSVTKFGAQAYTSLADVDRNGIINGGDRDRAQKNLGAAAQQPPTDGEENPLDVILPENALQLVGATPSTFNARGGLEWSLTGAELDVANAADFTLTINGAPVPATSLSVAEHLLTANVTLADGRNEVALKVYDTVGRPLYYNETLWAGSYTLRVSLVGSNGSAFLQQATVTAALSDDPDVKLQATTSNGVVTFANVPGRTILLTARGAANEIGTAGVLGFAGSVQIRMTGFNPASTIDNNDFALGTAGWDIGSAPVTIVPHQELIPGFPAEDPVEGASAVSANGFGVATNALIDEDLMLSTGGEGEQSISRTFQTSPETTAVKIRYRFITTEVPGGYYGTQYNDYFRVTLRTLNAGGAGNETASMNGLGLGAFDFGSGSTNWRELVLLVDSAGDTIQADIAVANVADGLLASMVVVDFVQEIRDQVRPSLAWNTTAGGLNLSYEVLRQATTSPVTINVHFANGTGYANRRGAAVFSHTVPAGTGVGRHGPIRVPGNLLANDPAGITHFIAAASASQVGAIADTNLRFGAQANAGVVPNTMRDIVKDGFRAAGTSAGTITSTARTPVDQARAMFNNLVRPGGVQAQLNLYGAPGDAVINVYVAETRGMTAAQIQANAGAIQAAMVAEINRQGPSRVSRHCGDPAVRSVVDVGWSSFQTTSGGRGRFRTSAEPRVDTFLNEPSNSCYHLELAR